MHTNKHEFRKETQKQREGKPYLPVRVHWCAFVVRPLFQRGRSRIDFFPLRHTFDLTFLWCMPKSSHCVVLVTAPNAAVGRKIAKSALENRLIACANIVPKIESLYWWEGKIEKGNEVLILLKTTRDKLKALEASVLGNHPYDTPEFVVLDIARGNKRYLDWIAASVNP